MENREVRAQLGFQEKRKNQSSQDRREHKHFRQEALMEAPRQEDTRFFRNKGKSEPSSGGVLG